MPTVEWRDGPAELQADSLATWQGQVQTPGMLTCSGACPRCKATFSHEIPASSNLVTSAADGKASFEAATLFQCGCTDPHPNRPPTTVRGCGAYWVARPKKNTVGDRYQMQVVAQPDLVDAARLVAEEARAASTGLRTLAEKWIPGLGAITGVLGLAGVVVAKDSVEGLSQAWRIGAFALVATAILAAAGGAALAYRAAFGWPKEVPLTTDAEVLAAARRISTRTGRVATGLRTAVALSFASLAALVAALAIVWLQPDDAGPVMVTFTDEGDQATVCGELGEIKDGELELEVTDGARTTTEQIDLETMSSLKQVTRCGE